MADPVVSAPSAPAAAVRDVSPSSVWKAISGLLAVVTVTLAAALWVLQAGEESRAMARLGSPHWRAAVERVVADNAPSRGEIVELKEELRSTAQKVDALNLQLARLLGRLDGGGAIGALGPTTNGTAAAQTGG